MKVDREQLREWMDRLHILMDEMAQVYGDPQEGTYQPRLESLVRIAWEVAYDEWKIARETDAA